MGWPRSLRLCLRTLPRRGQRPAPCLPPWDLPLAGQEWGDEHLLKHRSEP